MAPVPETHAERRRPPLFVLAALVLALVVGWIYSGAVDTSRSWGWDESMHAGLPAERIALSLQAGDTGEFANVIHGCMQYPFVWPLVVGALHARSGAIGEPAIVRNSTPRAGDIETQGRELGRWAMALMLLGLALLARECWRGTRSPWGLLMAPLLALASPLLINYSGTWFLEAPFAAVATFTLLAWVRRARLLASAEPSPRAWLRDLATGGLIALAFFTKFNYGLLLGFGLAIDLALDFVMALRGRGAAMRPFLIATLRLAILPALSFAWWFLLPLPLGADIAAAHREALAAFLAGNQELVRTPDSLRLLHWTTSFVATPRLFVVVLVGLVMSLVFSLRQLRCGCSSARNQLRLWIVFVAMALPILTHNFHLDRFLVAFVPLVMPLAAVGWAALFAAGLGRFFGFESRATTLGPLALAPLLLLASLVGRSWDGQLMFAKTVGFSDKPAVDAYQHRVLAEFQALGPGRPLATAGLERHASDALLKLVNTELEARAKVLDHPARFGWLGISSELSPAALHIGIHDLAGEPKRLRQDAATVRGDGNPAMIVTFEGVDPGWNDEQLRVWAAGFDVVFTTTPPDLRGRGSRNFIQSYQQRLIDSGAVARRELGSVQVPQPFGPPKLVRLLALTSNPR